MPSGLRSMAPDAYTVRLSSGEPAVVYAPSPAPFLAIPGGYEWIVIVLIVVLLFGKRIPGVARSLGSGINEFKQGLREGNEKDESADEKQAEDGRLEERKTPAAEVEEPPRSKAESGS